MSLNIKDKEERGQENGDDLFYAYTFNKIRQEKSGEDAHGPIFDKNHVTHVPSYLQETQS